MGSFINPFERSFLAATNLTGYHQRFIKLGTDGKISLCGAAEYAEGILESAAQLADMPCTISCAGLSKVMVDAAYPIGTYLMSTTDGIGTEATYGSMQYSRAKMLEASEASGDIVSIRFLDDQVGAQGATGITVQGATGIRGVTGLVGNTGIQGLTGLIGATGSSGLGTTGIQGSTGIDGQTGIQGLTGLALGATGIQGTTGLVGNTGIQGITGLIGGTGIQGSTGVQGGTGIQGITGLVGSTVDPWMIDATTGSISGWDSTGGIYFYSVAQGATGIFPFYYNA